MEKKLQVLSVEQALQRLSDEATTSVRGTQKIAIEKSCGRVIAVAVNANVSAPPVDNSAMDGFAINSSTVVAGQVVPISQRIAAGDQSRPLDEGTAARIFTGAMMPANADCVVIQENCSYDEHNVTINTGVKANAHVRRQGSDIAKGDLVLPQGHRIRAQDIGLLITAGIRHIEVYSPIRVGVIATGSELIDINEELTTGRIYESNSPMIASLLTQMDCLSTRYRTKDSLAETEAVLEKALAENDLVITIGGVSVGEEDHVQDALNSLGKTEFWKINMKPGKPFLFGRARGKAVMGLPGNPVSAFVTFSLFCRPFILKSAGGQFQRAKQFLAQAAFATSKTSDRQDYLRGQSQWIDGRRLVKPVGKQLSSMQGSLCAADVLIVVPPESLITEGQMVEVISIV